MGFKLNKKNFDFGVGTGSSPNKIGTEFSLLFLLRRMVKRERYLLNYM